ncbi:MAG TPA: DUF2282 domain-containing protein [Gammaproteobacteria bacterium]|nr:DUF2282 domain-containing protein [Gammaproteobacteria bacterium]
MRRAHLIASGALSGLVALSMAGGALAADQAPRMERCYGINKAHMNDCKSADHACKGMAAKARDPDSFVKVPKGVCGKIAGGSTEPGR